jgi:hypothetical protein
VKPVKIRCIFAGTLAALLLCVSSMAAACDLSCGFALFRSDCHSPQIAADQSQRPEMAMAGTAMPEMAGDSSTNRPIVSSAPQSMPGHAVLADMGACARQSCDQAQALASKANRSTAAQFETVSTTTEFSLTESFRIAFQEAGGDIAPHLPGVQTPLDVSLRI